MTIIGDNNSNNSNDKDSLGIGEDYRGFIFVLHEDYGLMLLLSTRKDSKGPHFQTPGGHVEDYELMEAEKEYSDVQEDKREELLLKACKVGAARELWEETKIDIREDLDRLQPAILKKTLPQKQHLDDDDNNNNNNDNDVMLLNAYKQRLFFFLLVNDNDFPSNGDAMSMGIGKELKVVLSEEHTAFMFQSNPSEVVHMVTQHSGGKVSAALDMALTVDIEEQGLTQDDDDDDENDNKYNSSSLMVQQMVQQRVRPMFGPTQNQQQQQQQQQQIQLQPPVQECPESTSLGTPKDYILVGFVLMVAILVPLVITTIILWRRRRTLSGAASYHKVGTQGEVEEEEYEDEIMTATTATTTLELSKR